MKPNERLRQMSLARSMMLFIDLLDAELVDVDAEGTPTYRLRSGVDLIELRADWARMLALLETEEQAYLADRRKRP